MSLCVLVHTCTVCELMYRCVSVSRLERDVSQKRSLLDDIKLKLSAAQHAAETDADVMVRCCQPRFVDVKTSSW